MHGKEVKLKKITQCKSFQYSHNGYCYRLSAGNYFVMAAFNVPTERKYMIRVIGDCIGLRVLDTATYV